MRKKYLFNKWEYEILPENEYQKSLGNVRQNFYGFRLRIYKNDALEYTLGGFGVESMAEAYLKKYIIENEFNIELSDNEATT
jgi:hypothetical protein